MAFDYSIHKHDSGDVVRTTGLTKMNDFIQAAEDADNELLSKVKTHTHSGATGSVAITVCTSTTRPDSPSLGELIVETDTGRWYECTNETGPEWTRKGDLIYCTSATRPSSPKVDALIFETDTGLFYRCTNETGPVWTKCGSWQASEITWDSTNSGVNASSVQEYLDGQVNIWPDSGSTTNYYQITPSPAVTAYKAGQRFLIQVRDPGGDNTGPCFLKVNTGGWGYLRMADGEKVAPGRIKSGDILEVVCDGADFIVTSINYRPVTSDNATAVLSGGTATTWTVVDLSSYVPEGARWALLDIEIQKAANDYIVLQLKKNGNTNPGVVFGARGDGTTANTRGRTVVWCEVDVNRYIQYQVATGSSANIIVVGYM